MKTGKCKLSLQPGELPSFIRNETNQHFKQKCLLIFTALLLVVTMSVMSAFIFQSLSNIKRLNSEVQSMKYTILNLKTLIGDRIGGDRYEELASDDESANDDSFDYSIGNFDDYDAGAEKLDSQDSSPTLITLTNENNSKVLVMSRRERRDTNASSDHLSLNRTKKEIYYRPDDHQLNSEIGTVKRRRYGHLETMDETVPTPNHPRPSRFRPLLPTAHFSGDTSKYVLGHHENFHGNGHLRHAQRTYLDWMESSWMRGLGMEQHFAINEGVVTIKQNGLYFIYAQIFYLDEHDINGFKVDKNGEKILQCTITAHSLVTGPKGNTCYTAGAEYLQEGDRINLVDLADSRLSIFQPGQSFFGIIKLGDVRVK